MARSGRRHDPRVPVRTRSRSGRVGGAVRQRVRALAELRARPTGRWGPEEAGSHPLFGRGLRHRWSRSRGRMPRCLSPASASARSPGWRHTDSSHPVGRWHLLPAGVPLDARARLSGARGDALAKPYRQPRRPSLGSGAGSRRSDVRRYARILRSGCDRPGAEPIHRCFPNLPRLRCSARPDDLGVLRTTWALAGSRSKHVGWQRVGRSTESTYRMCRRGGDCNHTHVRKGSTPLEALSQNRSMECPT